MKFFEEEFWKSPKGYLIFGEKLQPHPTKPASKGALYRRHKKVLEHLKRMGKIADLTGLQYYSWKDTGITDIIEDIGLMK